MYTHEKYIYVLYPTLIKYPLIIKALLKNRNSSGVCCISQKEIAKEVGLSQIAISKYLKRLEQYDKCVEKISPAKYIVHKVDMFSYGPVSKVLAFHNLAAEDFDFFTLDFKDQVKKLGFSKEAVLMAKHHYIKYLNKFEECLDEEDVNKKMEDDFVNYVKCYFRKDEKNI